METTTQVNRQGHNLYTPNQIEFIKSASYEDIISTLGLTKNKIYQLRYYYKHKKVQENIEPTIGLVFPKNTKKNNKNTKIITPTTEVVNNKAITFDINGMQLEFATPVKKIMFSKGKVSIEM